MSPVQYVCQASTFSYDWTQANSLEAQTRRRQDEGYQYVWTPPNPGSFKCNVDASFFEDQGKTSFGMSIRDEYGHFIIARTYWVPFCPQLLREKLLLF